MKIGRIIFIVNLLQDVNIIRPLTYLAACELNLNIGFLVAAAFRKRDKTGLWQQELNEMATDTHSSIHDFENEYQALKVLQDGQGALIAASESHLDAHKVVHNLFRIAPSQYVKITLQHGFECVGFLQSRDQILAHGHDITFAADVICGWCSPERLTAVAPSQRHKLRVTGPTALLATPIKRTDTAAYNSLDNMGLVCENMHSPRLNVAGDFKSEFLEIFEKFCAELDRDDCQIALRPHPGGQYVIKNDVRLLPNVVLENDPIYKIDLTQFAYGISAPSSILIDMVLAGIPTAVWQDEKSVMDLGNYEGLTRISTLDDWLVFARDALEHPQYYLEKQQVFLQKQKLLIDQAHARRIFSELLQAHVNLEGKVAAHQMCQARVLLVVPGSNPTVQFSFLKPLAHKVASGDFAIDIISEVHLNAEFKSERALFLEAREWLKKRIDSFSPTIVIYCRWAGPHTAWMLNYLSSKNIPTIYHIDDDLLNVPKEIGLNKWRSYNQPRRLFSIRYLLDNVDLVYASTNKLKLCFESLCVKAHIESGVIINSNYRLDAPRSNSVKRIGYMGIGHEKDLAMVLRAIIKYLRANIEVTFQFFGTIPLPNELLEFGSRISMVPKVENYDDFLIKLSQLQWDIGICPLTSHPFNHLKSNVKWIEYSGAGVAVIASRGMVYDECCSEGCGILADTEKEWFAALEYLTRYPHERIAMVNRAQAKLLRDYSPSKMQAQVLSMVRKATELQIAGKIKKSGRMPVSCKQERILFVANNLLPTLEIYFTNPLMDLANDGVIEYDFISELHVKKRVWEALGYMSVSSWIIDRFNKYTPSLLVFVRYSGRYSELLLELADVYSVPVIYHIDDDLMNVPVEMGAGKWEYHNKPDRITVVRRLLESSTLIFASTQRLKDNIAALGFVKPIVTTQITCPMRIQNEASPGVVRKIGYLGGVDHEHDFSIIVDALVLLLRKHTQIKFEIYGSMPIPEKMKEFSDRIHQIPPNDNYAEFLIRFSECDWDIGLCPLAKIHFNFMKTPIKWFDYTSIGAAVVATRGTVYDSVCADECGDLVENQFEWFDAIDKLISDPSTRYHKAVRAQRKLKNEYSTERYRQQLLNIFGEAHQLLHHSQS